MIMDTTVLIDLLRDRQDAVIKLKELQKRNVPLFLTSISVFELWQGISDVHNERKSQQLYNLLESLGAFIFDIPSAKASGIIHAGLKKEGQMIDSEDSMIAGIAKTNNETLLTRNVKHFQRVPGLKVESY